MNSNGFKHNGNGSGSAALMVNSNGTSGSGATWQLSTVRDFFTRVNWTDQPPEVQAIQLTSLQGDQPALSLQLTVSQFFSGVPWDGRAVAAPIGVQAAGNDIPAPSQEMGFTIDDFAGLF
jgi:hypothetical protein